VLLIKNFVKKHFKVEIRNNCLICGDKLPKRFRTYCSTKCRNKRNYLKNYEYNKKWQKRKRGEYADGKKKCIYCGNWYVQVGSHIFQTHHETAREYREENNLPVKRGIVPSWFRELKGKQAIENGTYKNLEGGKKTRYTKGDKRAKENRYWKSHRYEPDDYYE
jgi:predicted nucleic acid-binding Zn ribbon protein